MVAPIMLIAGFDAAYSRDGRLQAGAWAVWSSREERLVEWVGGRKTDPPPYIPGRFYLRECDLAVDLLPKLKTQPDLLLIDGHGKAHPEGRGLACRIGEQAGLPAIGVAKEILCGRAGTLEARRGSMAPIAYEGRTVGMAVRTVAVVRPVFVSVGFHIGLDEAARWILTLSVHRIPEPLREAHRLAGVVLRNEFAAH